MTHKKTVNLTAAPGYIVCRQVEREELMSPGGIILPSKFLPIVKVIHDGGHDDNDGTTSDFEITPGAEYVVSCASVMLNFGIDSLYIVPHSAIVAKVDRL